MRFKSRSTVIGILAVLAIMAITIVPASADHLIPKFLASGDDLKVTVLRNDGNPVTNSTRVGSVIWVSDDDSAFNQVQVNLENQIGGDIITVSVENTTLGGTKLTVLMPDTRSVGTLTVDTQPTGVAATGSVIVVFNDVDDDTITIAGVDIVEGTGDDWQKNTNDALSADNLIVAINAKAALNGVVTALIDSGDDNKVDITAVVSDTASGGSTATATGNQITLVLAAVGAQGLTTLVAMTGGLDDTMKIGDPAVTGDEKEYTFVGTLTSPAVDGEIDIGATLGATQTNIVNAINLIGTTGFSSVMTRHLSVRLGAFVSDASPVTHKPGGVAGDSVATTSVFKTTTNKFTATTLGGGADSTSRTGTFFVGTTTTAEPAGGLGGNGIIGALDLNVLQVVSGDEDTLGDVVKLSVDAKAPSITDLLPEHDEVTRAKTIDFRATIEDSGSGLVTDVHDADNDGITEEPVSGASGTRTDDISILVNSAENSDRALWTEITAGKKYSFTFAKALLEANHDWQITATDRVGNTETTDSGDQGDDDAHEFIIDATAAVMGVVTTGIEWDSTDKEESRDDASIKIVFTKTGSTTEADNMDGSTLQASDFQVEDNTVTGLTFPNLSSSKGKVFVGGVLTSLSTENIVYLALGDDVAADGTPKVSLVGTVTDRAGNVSAIGEEDAIDGIRPDFTVTITGLTASRPITDDDDDNEIVVRIVSNEQLNAAPTVRFNTLVFDDSEDPPRLEVDLSVTRPGKVVSGLTNTWEVKQTRAAVAGGNDGLISVHVEGTDLKANTGTDGSGRDPEDKVDLTKANLFEFDSDLADPGFKLTPVSGADKTESSSPFIRINFDTEGEEYQIDTTPLGTPTLVDELSFGTPPVDVEIDSHDAVTLTKLELKDEDGNTTDLLGTQGTVDENSFVVSLPDLAVGTYTLTVNGTDDVGNKLSSDKKFAFEVEKRSSYKVTLDPGWNLISLPGTPADPSIDSVLPDSMKVSRVLQWVSGAFEVAERNDDGTWDLSGGVTELVAGPGYWVFTTAFEDIKTLIPERNPATVLPTVDIVGGWNLVGVVDQTQAEQGDPPGDVVTEASVYFSSIEWSVAYSYDTTTAKWTKYIEATDDDLIVNGKGYWVWASKAGTLVP